MAETSNLEAGSKAPKGTIAKAIFGPAPTAAGISPATILARASARKLFILSAAAPTKR